jgi:hypothetical protein
VRKILVSYCDRSRDKVNKILKIVRTQMLKRDFLADAGMSDRHTATANPNPVKGGMNRLHLQSYQKSKHGITHIMSRIYKYT